MKYETSRRNRYSRRANGDTAPDRGTTQDRRKIRRPERCKSGKNKEPAQSKNWLYPLQCGHRHGQCETRVLFRPSTIPKAHESAHGQTRTSPSVWATRQTRLAKERRREKRTRILPRPRRRDQLWLKKNCRKKPESRSRQPVVEKGRLPV